MRTELPAWQPCALKRPCPSSAFRRTLKSEPSQRSTPRKNCAEPPLQTIGHCEEMGVFCWQGAHKVREADGTSHFVTLLHRHSCQFWSHLIFDKPYLAYPAKLPRTPFLCCPQLPLPYMNPFCLTLKLSTSKKPWISCVVCMQLIWYVIKQWTFWWSVLADIFTTWQTAFSLSLREASR